MVLDAFAALAPAFADRAERLLRPSLDRRRGRGAGKQSGAYSHPVTAERHPYVFLNYMGERRDVLTLAHELGHAVHQTLAAPAGHAAGRHPADPGRDRLDLRRGAGVRAPAGRGRAGRTAARSLAGKIEDGLNTVVRQIAFHRFETRFHAARARGELSAEADRRPVARGDGREPRARRSRLNPGYEHYWAYVSHFVHAPFYVYAYAFGTFWSRR